MSYPRIFDYVYLRPLCLSAERFASIHAFLKPRILGQVPLEVPSFEPKAGDLRPNRSMMTGRRNQFAGPRGDGRFYDEPKQGVATIPIYGALAKNLSAWEEECGGGLDINRVEFALRQVLAAGDIHSVVLDIDSPGGSATGIPELAALVAQVARAKTVYAFSDSTIASAAYWLASQATEVYATGSSTIGSIGTYIAWLDPAIKMEMEGITLRLYKEGKHKGIGLPGRTMTKEDDEYLQSLVTEINDQFVGAVRAARPGVPDGAMEGQTFTGRRAIDAGLIDGLVESFDELLAAI